MLFRRGSSVTNVHIVRRGTLRVTVGHPPIHLEISSREEGGLYATATIEADPPDEVAEAIRAVAGGGDPELLRSDAAITYANEPPGSGQRSHGCSDVRFMVRSIEPSGRCRGLKRCRPGEVRHLECTSPSTGALPGLATTVPSTCAWRCCPASLSPTTGPRSRFG